MGIPILRQRACLLTLIFLCFAELPLSARTRPAAAQAEASAPQSSPTSFAQPERVVVSANGRMVAYVRGDVLWARRLDINGGPVGSPLRVSNGMRRDAGFGESEFEALSPDGSRLAFRTGHGGYRNQGELRVGFIDGNGRVRVRPLVQSAMSSRLQTFAHFAGRRAAWSRDNRHVAFPAMDTSQDKHLQVYVADAETGTLERWTDDSTWKLSVAWSPDGRRLAVGTGDFVSRTATMLFITSARQTREVVRVQGRWLTDLLWSPNGEWLVAGRDSGVPLVAHVAPDEVALVEDVRLPRLRFVAFTPDSRALLARRSEGMSAHLVLVDRSNGRVSVLTPGDMLFSPVGVGGKPGRAVVIFTAESGALPREVRSARLTSDGTRLLRNPAVARSVGALRGGVPFIFQIFRWTSPKADSLEAKLYLPRRKSSGSPPPLVVVPYGGYVNNFDDPSSFLEQVLLELMRRGWAVAFPNTRGIASESVIGHYGDIQLEDTLKMMEALHARGLVNARRTAVIGHSHGGAMAYYYATHSTRFCAVVGINGRADWEAQARHPPDGVLVRELGSPDNAPEIYARFSPLRNVSAVTAPILAVAGKLDTQILPANASRMVSALHAANRRAELLEFADEGHLIVKPENVHRLWNKVSALLDGSCRGVRPD